MSIMVSAADGGLVWQALMKGEWKKAYDTLAELPSWKLIPNHEEILKMLQQKLQEEGLRTYLLAYGNFYKSLSHQQLSSMFDLPEKRVGLQSHTLPQSPFTFALCSFSIGLLFLRVLCTGDSPPPPPPPGDFSAHVGASGLRMLSTMCSPRD